MFSRNTNFDDNDNEISGLCAYTFPTNYCNQFHNVWYLFEILSKDRVKLCPIVSYNFALLKRMKYNRNHTKGITHKLKENC